MIDVHFENAGCEPGGGRRSLIVGPRRLLRRILRPMIVQLVNILNNLDARIDDRERAQWALSRELLDLRRELDAALVRIDESATIVRDAERSRREEESRRERLHARLDAVEDRVVATTGLAWDHVAAVRRIGSIEDRLAGLERALSAAGRDPETLRIPPKDARPAKAG